MKLRRVDNYTNLLYLAREYACLAIVIGGAVVFGEYRAGWGLSWSWNIPVFSLAIVLVGGLQHRLAGLGHEASHYTFMKNRFLSDLIPDFLCMFPILTTVHFYRVFHMAHHQYTNDPERDPDLLNLGRGKRAFEFPMTRTRFIALIYFCFVTAPIRFMEFQLAYIAVNAFGKGRSIYLGTHEKTPRASDFLPRMGTALGLVFLAAFLAWIRYLVAIDRPGWIIPSALLSIAGAGIAIALLPGWAMFPAPFRQAYSPRFAALIRLSFYVVVLSILVSLRWATEARSSIYPYVLWFLPLLTTFPFFMLLRDVYQHSNADAGRLTNSRVFFTDPFTHWAVFVYGQDMHIPHHLFPAIPHYRLGELHRVLKEASADYDRDVVECHGTFHDRDGRITIIDEMTRPKEFPGAKQPAGAAVAGG